LRARETHEACACARAQNLAPIAAKESAPVPNVLDLITPYRRVCGALLLLIIALVAPNLRFVTAVLGSQQASVAAPLVVFALYVLIVFLPPVRRVTLFASWVVLVVVGLAICVGLGFDAEIKRVLADTAGVYEDEPVWRDVAFPGATSAYQHPLAGYTLRAPDTWQLTSGPTDTDKQFIRSQGAKRAAILRPSCDVNDQPLAVTVQRLQERWPEARRVCSHTRGLHACLLRRPLRDGSGEAWEWIAQKPGSRRSMWLQFLMYDALANKEAFAIIDSARPVPDNAPSLPCPVPAEWATPDAR
jgi:hypothetical protein